MLPGPHKRHIKGKKKLFAVLKRHLRRYCASQAVAQKFPYLKEEDSNYFTHHIAISELDIEDKPDIEIADLANYIPNFNRVKTLFDFFFEEYLLLRQDQILICYLYLDNSFLLFI